MSQAKVNRYKEEKKNRAKIMAKEKRERMIAELGAGVIGLALVVWMGFSVYQSFTATDTSVNDTTVETEAYTVNTSALDDYINSLSES